MTAYDTKLSPYWLPGQVALPEGWHRIDHKMVEPDAAQVCPRCGRVVHEVEGRRTTLMAGSHDDPMADPNEIFVARRCCVTWECLYVPVRRLVVVRELA